MLYSLMACPLAGICLDPFAGALVYIASGAACRRPAASSPLTQERHFIVYKAGVGHSLAHACTATACFPAPALLATSIEVLPYTVSFWDILRCTLPRRLRPFTMRWLRLGRRNALNIFINLRHTFVFISSHLDLDRLSSACVSTPTSTCVLLDLLFFRERCSRLFPTSAHFPPPPTAPPHPSQPPSAGAFVVRLAYPPLRHSEIPAFACRIHKRHSH
ncbi:hypothetical protein R3P38DRAFT_1961162 [Favolaschia claudopus]|uniref:Uncharacterized protein n=1 Tax=Favolaschia claudopus TaxID=2862362 RepID=A0AAV9ZZ32_9AGAR